MKYNCLILLLISLNLTQNYSQEKDSNNLVFCGTDISSAYLHNGNSLTGPSIGYSLKSKVLSYAVNYEYAFAQNRAGIFTAGISGKYSANSEEIFENTAKLKTSDISLGLLCNFNLNNLASKSIVPFAGLIVGYTYSVTKYNFSNNKENPLFPETKKHSLYFFGQAGVRFFVSRSMALTLRSGTGNIHKSVIELGFVFKL